MISLNPPETAHPVLLLTSIPIGDTVYTSVPAGPLQQFRAYCHPAGKTRFAPASMSIRASIDGGMRFIYLDSIAHPNRIAAVMMLLRASVHGGM